MRARQDALHPAIRRRSAATRVAVRAARRAVRTTGVWVTIQFFYHDRGAMTRRCDTALWARDTAQQHACDKTQQRARARDDTVGQACYTTGDGPRHGPVRATTRCYARSQGPWVCALCTQSSFDSVHYLQSLF